MNDGRRTMTMTDDDDDGRGCRIQIYNEHDPTSAFDSAPGSVGGNVHQFLIHKGAKLLFCCLIAVLIIMQFKYLIIYIINRINAE